MKRTVITLLSATILTTSAFAQSDTIVINNPDKVKVSTVGDTLSVSIIGEKDNPDFFYKKKVIVDSGKENVTTTSKDASSGLGWDFSLIESNTNHSELELSLRAQLYLGWNIPLGKPSAMKLKGFPSYEAGLDLLHITVKPRNYKWKVSLDWGMFFNSYYFKDCMMATDETGNIYFTDFPDGSSSQSSSFLASGSSLSLMGYYHLGKRHEIGLGATWNAMADDSNYKSKYTLADGTQIANMAELPIRKHLFSVKAEYWYRNVGMYIRYTPMSILHKNTAPEFQQMNIGFQVKF